MLWEDEDSVSINTTREEIDKRQQYLQQLDPYVPFSFFLSFLLFLSFSFFFSFAYFRIGQTNYYSMPTSVGLFAIRSYVFLPVGHAGLQ